MIPYINIPKGYIAFEDSQNIGSYYCITIEENKRIREIERYPYGKDYLVDPSILIEAFPLIEVDGAHSLIPDRHAIQFPLFRYKTIVLSNHS